MRVQFCGAIQGSVTIRPGETEEDALQRAQDLLLDIMDRHAKGLGCTPGNGPNIGLELDDTLEARSKSTIVKTIGPTGEVPTIEMDPDTMKGPLL